MRKMRHTAGAAGHAQRQLDATVQGHEHRRRVGVVISVVAFVLIELTLWGIILRADTDGAREVLLYAVTALWPLVVVLWTKVRGAGWAYPAVRRV